MGFLEDLAQQHGIKTQDQINELNDRYYKHITIGDDIFKVKMLGGRKGVSIALKLKSIALPLIGQGVDGIKAEKVAFETPQTFTQMAMILCQQMEHASVETLILDDILYEVSIKDGDRWVKLDWDEFLIANYGALIPLLTFALKENFESFFTGNGMMKGILSKLRTMLTSQEDTPENTENE